ncbi:MAG: hypothetical protein CME70_15795 [Halobacteriovorax sp.]|nr:hypothetical protein [Halobacteriovorax sp.]
MNYNKILYISPNGFWGGAEKFVLENLLLHQRSGLFTPVVLFLNNGPIAEETKKLGIPTYILPFPLRMRNPFSFIRALGFILKIIRSENIELVHSTMSYAHLLGAPAAYLSKIPEVWFQHGPVGNLWDKVGKFIPSRKILFNSSFLMNQQKFIFGPNHLMDEEVLPLGVDINKNVNFDKGKFVKKDESLLLWVGRISFGKGLHLTIEALGLLKKELPFKMLVVGSPSNEEDEEYFKKLKRRIEELNLTESIEFLGNQKEVSAYYNTADLLIHSAVIPESFGLVVAEGLGHGALVLASIHGGVADFFSHFPGGKNFIYDSFRSDASILLAEKIKMAINYPVDNVLAFKAGASDYIMKEHSHSKMNQELERIYSEILNK